MASEKKNILEFDYLPELEPCETISMISAYRFQPPNSEKDAMIEFAIRLAASCCRGEKRPTIEKVQLLLQNVGEFYKHYSTKETPSLSSFFSSQALFSNQVEGNVDQAIESIWKRFQKHDKFLENKIGFNVANAIFFATKILSTITARMEKTKPPKVKKLTKSQYYDFAFFVKPEEQIVRNWSKAIRFNLEEIEKLFSTHLLPKLRKYIEFVSIPLNNMPKIEGPLEADPLVETPIIKFHNEYLIPTPYYLLHGLSSRLHIEMIGDANHAGKYGQDKGQVLEERASEELGIIFRSGKQFRNVKYETSGSEADADIIVNYGEYLIFVECTTKGIPESSRRGNLASVDDTLARSIGKCYRQVLRAKRAFMEGRLNLKLDSKPSKFILMIVTDMLYPNLLSEFMIARSYGTDSYLTGLLQDKEYPYIISIYDLESIRHVTNEETFLSFLLERLSMYEQPYLIANDEYDYFILFSKPEYKEIKEKIIQVQTVLSYVAHLPSPVVKPHIFKVLLETIGSDEFAVIKIGKKYDRTLAGIVFSLLYDLYCEWDAVLKHFVFDAKRFNSLIKEYEAEGRKCRCVAWEGFYEYLDFCKQTGRNIECSETEQEIKRGSIGTRLNVLIVFPSDIYEKIREEIQSKK